MLLALLLVPKQVSAETITYDFTTKSWDKLVQYSSVVESNCTFFTKIGTVSNPDRFAGQNPEKWVFERANQQGVVNETYGLCNNYGSGRKFLISNLKAGDVVTFDVVTLGNASNNPSLSSTNATANGSVFTMNQSGSLVVTIPNLNSIKSITIDHPAPVVLNQYNYDYSIETYDLTNKTWTISAGESAGFNYPNGGGPAKFISNPNNYELNNRIIVMGNQISQYTYNNGLYNNGGGTRIVSINDLHIGDRVKITYSGNAYFRTSHTDANNFAAANDVFLDTQNDGEKNLDEDVLIQAGDRVESNAIYTMLFDGRIDIGLDRYASIQKIEIISDRTCNFVTDENNDHKLVFDGTGQLTSKSSYVAGLMMEFSNSQKSNEAVHVTASDRGYKSVCEDDEGFKMARRSDLGTDLTKAPNNGTFYKFIPEVNGFLKIAFKAQSVSYGWGITRHDSSNETETSALCPYYFVEADENGNIVGQPMAKGRLGNGAWRENYNNGFQLEAGKTYYFYGWWETYNEENPNQEVHIEGSCGVAQLVSVEFDPDFELSPLAKCVVNGTTEDSELATVTATNPTVTVKRKSNNILTCTPTISNGKLQISGITFDEGSDQAGVILLEVRDGVNTPQVFTLTIAYSASYNNGKGHKWDFSSEPLEIGRYFKDWFANVGSDGRGYANYFHPSGQNGNNGNDYFEEQVLNSGSLLYSEMSEAEPDWRLEYARKVIDANNNNFTTYYDPMFVNVYNMEGDNADMIWETEGLWFNTAPNESCLFNEYIGTVNRTFVSQDASKDPDRYVGIRKGGEFRIPKLYKDDRVIIYMGSAKGSGVEDEEFGGKRTLLFDIENARDAVYQDITDPYWVGGSIWNVYRAESANEHDHTDPNYRGAYHFFATGDPSDDTKPADMIFKLTEGSLCKIYSIEIYHDGTHHYTNAITHASSRYDFWNNNISGNLTVGADGDSNGGLAVHFRGKGEKVAQNGNESGIKNEVLSYSGKISNLNVPSNGNGSVSYTSKVGDFGVILMRVKVMDYNQKYVTDFADRNLTVGYLEKKAYPYTWDFTDMKKYSGQDIAGEDSTFPKTTYANGTSIPAWEDQKIFNLSLWEKGDVKDPSGNVVYQDVYKMNVYVPGCRQDDAETNTHYIFSNNKAGGGNELFANGKIIPETQGLQFYMDNNDQIYSGRMWIDTDGLHLCNATHEDWWNYKTVIPAVPSGGAVYARVARDTKAVPDDAVDFQNDSYIYKKFQFGHMAQKATMGVERTDICKYYQADDETGDYIIAIYNDGVESPLTLTLNGYVLKKLAVSTDSKTIGSTGFATESRSRDIDHTLTGYMTGLPIKAYMVTNAVASTAEQIGTVTVTPVEFNDKNAVLPANTGCFLANDMYNEEATDKSVKVVNNQTHLFVPDMHDASNSDNYVSTTGNMMKARAQAGYIPATEGGMTNFVLSNKYVYVDNPDVEITNNKVNFYRVIERQINGQTVGATTGDNSAYLQIPTSTANGVKAFFLVMEGSEDPLAEDFGDQDITAVKGIENAADIEGDWYNMNGQKLNGRPTSSGIYVVNGKKVVIK